ncbi:MAG: DUF1080 domain-containing protein [Deltaproteobacteria bacterium]|nr:DUF1080 domain-containing protein [Deltaproteobacteria bacterium]
MKKLIPFLLVMALLIPNAAFSYTFQDDFNDGDLAGWTPKQGDWSNEGDYLLSSSDNYGIIWKDDSSGFDQFFQVDAYFDSASISKSARLFLRAGVADGLLNQYWDHGYEAIMKQNYVAIQNHVMAGNQILLGTATPTFSMGAWHTIAFEVSGLGTDTNLKMWVDGTLCLNVFDTSGSQHDDGGYIGLGSSNHLNRRINYDNAEGYVDVTPTPAPSAILLLGSGLLGLAGFRKKFKS